MKITNNGNLQNEDKILNYRQISDNEFGIIVYQELEQGRKKIKEEILSASSFAKYIEAFILEF